MIGRFLVPHPFDLDLRSFRTTGSVSFLLFIIFGVDTSWLVPDSAFLFLFLPPVLSPLPTYPFTSFSLPHPTPSHACLPASGWSFPGVAI